MLLRARAIETQCFVAAAAQVGAYPTGKDVRQNWGHSMILDPWGKVLVQVPERPGFATARLDLEHLARVREMLPVGQHRVLSGLAALPARKRNLCRSQQLSSGLIGLEQENMRAVTPTHDQPRRLAVAATAPP